MNSRKHPTLNKTKYSKRAESTTFTITSSCSSPKHNIINTGYQNLAILLKDFFHILRSLITFTGYVKSFFLAKIAQVCVLIHLFNI